MSYGRPLPRTAEELFRRHLAAMRVYALEIEPALGSESAIIARIRRCATSNEDALNRICPPKCGECGKPKEPGS